MAASPEAKFTEEKVLWIKHHTPKLMTFAISRPESYRFSAGQFSRLGFRDGEGFIWRAIPSCLPNTPIRLSISRC